MFSTHKARTKYVYIPECAPAVPYLRRDPYAILVDLFEYVESCECVRDSKKEAHVCEAIAWAQPAQPLLAMSELHIKVVIRTVCQIQMWLLQDLEQALIRGTYPDQMTSGLCSDWRRVSAPCRSRQINVYQYQAREDIYQTLGKNMEPAGIRQPRYTSSVRDACGNPVLIGCLSATALVEFL